MLFIFTWSLNLSDDLALCLSAAVPTFTPSGLTAVSPLTRLEASASFGRGRAEAVTPTSAHIALPASTRCTPSLGDLAANGRSVAGSTFAFA